MCVCVCGGGGEPLEFSYVSMHTVVVLVYHFQTTLVQSRGHPVGFLLAGTHAGTIANNKIVLFNQKSIIIICDVLNGVFSYISGLCTAAVELHNAFTLNYEILYCTL